jgi:threonine/homoserine/homoserine lactone efflux protein
VIIAIIIGFVTGWVISMPIGPVNASAISRTLKHGYKFGLATGFGAALMDLIYCGFAAEIHQFLETSPIINLCFQILGFVLLIFIGLKTVRTSVPPPVTMANEERSETLTAFEMRRLHLSPGKGFLQSFGVGVVLYASNVAAVPEWIFVSALWRNYGLLQTGVAINTIFAVGAGLGTAGWFYFLVRYIDKRQRGFQPGTLAKINKYAGIALLLFGVYFLYQIAFKTNWAAVGSSFSKNTQAIEHSIN